MEIYERIRYERKRTHLTQQGLREILAEEKGIDVSLRTIQRWEEAKRVQSLGIIELQGLCEIFEITAEDFLDNKKMLIAESNENILAGGKELSAWTLQNNYYDLLSLYFISSEDKVDLVPRYDIEIREMGVALRYAEDGLEANRVESLLFWIQKLRDYGKRDYSIQVVKDDVGSRTLYDDRVIFNPREIVLTAEWLKEELIWLSQEFISHNDGEERLDDGYFVQKEKYS